MSILGGILGYFSAKKKAKEQIRHQNMAIDVNDQAKAEQLANLNPLMDFSKSTMNPLQQLLANPVDTSYDTIMSSPQAKQMENNMMRNVLNMGAGVGNTGSSASNINMATISPQIYGQLRDNAIQDRQMRVNELFRPVNMLPGAVNSANNVISQSAANKGNLITGKGAMEAGRATAGLDAINRTGSEIGRMLTGMFA